jgi:hypothetical protein
MPNTVSVSRSVLAGVAATHVPCLTFEGTYAHLV